MVFILWKMLLVWLVLFWKQRGVSGFLVQPPLLPTSSVTTTTTTTTIQTFTKLVRRSSLHAKKSEEEEEDQVFEDPNDAKTHFSWDERWDDNISELIKYNETFGTVNVAYTHRLVGDEYASIALFCDYVRKIQGRLAKERHGQLTSMGFTWEGAKEEKDDQKWEEMYQRLEKYKKRNGDCLVPSIYERDEELGIWVKTQRAYKKLGILKEERIDKLNSIGFVWVVINRRKNGKHDRPDLEMQWEARRQELINYHKEYGHYWVPRDFKNKNNPLNPLGRWLHRQRVLHKQGNLRKDRVALLNEINFTWDSKNKLDKQWDNHFHQLKEILHKRSIGQINEEVYTRKFLGDVLYGWTRNQRMFNEKGTLNPKRRELLDGIGFDWIQVKDRD